MSSAELGNVKVIFPFGLELHPVAVQIGSALYGVLPKDFRVLARHSETERLWSKGRSTSLLISYLLAKVSRGTECAIKRAIERAQTPSSAYTIALQISALSRT